MTAEEIRAQREQCADCGGALQEIKMLQPVSQSPFPYFANEPKHSVWNGDTYLVAGTILAFRCSRCARISFYGAANDDEGDGHKKPADPDQ